MLKEQGWQNQSSSNYIKLLFFIGNIDVGWVGLAKGGSDSGARGWIVITTPRVAPGRENEMEHE